MLIFCVALSVVGVYPEYCKSSTRNGVLSRGSGCQNSRSPLVPVLSLAEQNKDFVCLAIQSQTPAVDAFKRRIIWRLTQRLLNEQNAGFIKAVPLEPPLACCRSNHRNPLNKTNSCSNLFTGTKHYIWWIPKTICRSSMCLAKIGCKFCGFNLVSISKIFDGYTNKKVVVVIKFDDEFIRSEISIQKYSFARDFGNYVLFQFC
jgi:hypothetical protein